MPAARYSAEFKAATVARFAVAGKSYKQLGAEVGVSGYSVRMWVLESQRQAAGRSATSERTELTRLRRENHILREERVVARSAADAARAARDLNWVYAFIQSERTNHAVKLLCRVMRYPTSSFYFREGVRARPASAASPEDARLLGLIESIHRGSGGSFGSLRITAALREQGEVVNHKRVRRLMRAAGIAGVSRRRSGAPTEPD